MLARYPTETVRSLVEPPKAAPLFRVISDPSTTFITRDDATTVVHAHTGQYAAYSAAERFVLILAGTRGGKTAIGPWWLLKAMQDKGPGEYLCAAPTFKLLRKGIYKALRRAFVAELHLGSIIGGAEGEFRFSPEGFARVWPGHPYNEEAKVAFGHAANPDSLEAAEYKAAWLDEPGQRGFPVESWEAIQRRLSMDQGPCLMTTTPYVISHWIKDQIHDAAVRREKGKGLEGDENYRVVSFKSTMNPAFPVAEYERAKRDLPDWKFGLFFDGRFTRPAGAVYDCWDPETMVGPAFVPDARWKRYVGIDFGAPNFCALFIAEEPGAELEGPPRRGQKHPVGPSTYHVYAEYRPNEARSAKEHVDAMRALREQVEGKNPPPIADSIGGSRSENQWRLDFAAAGWPIRPPDQPDVEVGIDRVWTVIKAHRLRVADTCTALIDDLNSYSRPVDEAGNVLEGLEDKETYHSCFVAGTMVETIIGPRPVEAIRPGDLVLTRQGYFPVAVGGLSTFRKVYRLTYQGGELIGTGDHPVWVVGRGFVRLDSLRYNDTLLSVNTGGESCVKSNRSGRPVGEKPSSTRVSRTTDTRTPRGGRSESTIHQRAGDCTKPFGGTLTGRSRRDTTFIMWTRTQAITPLTIWSCLVRWNMFGDILRLVRGWPSCGPIWNEFVTRRPNGTEVRRGVRGTENTQKTRSARLSDFGTSASIAERSTRLSSGPTPGSAPAIAGLTLAGIVETMTLTRRAWCAAVRFGRIGMSGFGAARRGAPAKCDPRLSSARAIASYVAPSSPDLRSSTRKSVAPRNALFGAVISVEPVGWRDVYNLSVDGPHEYFANGVLVSNCDAARYVLGYLNRKAAGWFFNAGTVTVGGRV